MTKMISMIKMEDMLKTLIQLAFSVYTLLLFARIALSWVPNLAASPFARFVYVYTEPYLKIFRQIIPPIGGMLDISVLFAFFALRMVQSFLMKVL